MKELKAEFSIKEFEDYGSSSLYLTQEQSSQVSITKNRANSQLNWLGQILGWRGDGYWDGLASTPNEKRQLLGGTFGVYNGFLYPEVVEIQNWNNSVVVKADERILNSSVVYVGDSTYTIEKITQNEDKYIISFGDLTDQFYTDIASNEQIRIISPQSLPAPFYRPTSGTAADASFLTQIITENGNDIIVLYPSYNEEKTLPYRLNVLFQGSRYYFDIPLRLNLNPPNTTPEYVEPEYDFLSERWHLDIPVNSSLSNGVGLSGTLEYGNASLGVSLSSWKNPSDWINKNLIENFRGVWNNKGGRLPFHFVFDSLSIHGFDEVKSVSLNTVNRSVSFDQLLEYVYYQKISVSTGPPYGNPTSQVWWNSQDGVFSIYAGDLFNCGPWVESTYPLYPEAELALDYVFPNVSAFTSYLSPIPEGCVVRIEDITGLGPSLGIEGITQVIPGAGKIDMVKEEGSQYWSILGIQQADESEFSANSQSLPTKVPVKLLDSNNLAPNGLGYVVENLKFTVSQQLPVLLMKSVGSEKWYIAPPSPMKYIGNTRLYASSLDYLNPVEGEMNWDYSNPDYLTRSARTFYYDNWVWDPLLGEYVLQGTWVGINEGVPSGPVPQVVDFGVVKVYCDGSLVGPNDCFSNENFQFSFTTNNTSGELEFSYVPLTYEGSVNFPKITISDSLTSVFSADISDVVFSGLQYYMSPNVMDSETLLRVWKSEKLSVVDSLSDLELLRNPNPLVADQNSGPADLNWERYFIRLSPTNGRNDSVWQKVNLICQDFGYWGSPVDPEVMSCPPDQKKTRIYEAVHLYGERPDSPIYLYSEPYLYSDVNYGTNLSEDFDNSFILPSYEEPYDGFYEASIETYDPLHTRLADVTSPVGRGYGEWVGGYYRAAPCSYPSGFLVNDLLSGDLEPIEPPLWDSSIYKLPPVCSLELSSSTVDANHFKVGYAFFAADLSAAEEGVFDLGRVK